LGYDAPMANVNAGRLCEGLLLGAALLMLVAGCATTRLWAPPREQVIERILPSSVQVILERDGRQVRTGSGVMIGARRVGQIHECFVLTSGHTVNGLSDRHEVYVLLGRHRGKGTRALATVLAQRETEYLDLALMRVETEGCVAARLGEPPGLGDPIWIVAFPWGRNMTLVGGNVSQVDPGLSAESDGSRLMVDAPVSYGASGGGVFEAGTGRLVGLVEGYRTARVSFKGEAPARYIDVPVPGETYVTSLADIRRFLTEAGYATLLPQR
jgi:serine protease Do